MGILVQIGCFSAMSALYVFGGYQLTRYASTYDGISLLLSIAAYFGGNALLLLFLKTGSYGTLMVLSSLAVLLGHVVISATFLGEKYSSLQFGGVVCALLAMALVGWPQTK